MKAREGNKERNNENKLHVFEMFFLLCIFVKVIVCMHGTPYPRKTIHNTLQYERGNNHKLGF